MIDDLFFIITVVDSQRKGSCLGSDAQSKFLKEVEKTIEVEADFILLE